ncbi:hypothetical protein LTR37_007036 [Vermiconidia calcicola]|uniref:Uncharacterized protein n=1 Tax=Vermiconidia calcicola TaxID=1690605 RepID=A0ACC3NFD7_9PEZI|nr:hypothetical protein LTR37_007036 [Vermiconidia calcicola]
MSLGIFSARQPDLLRDYGILGRTFASGYGYQGGEILRHQKSIGRIVWTIIGVNAAVFGAWQLAITEKNQTLYRNLDENFKLSLNNWKDGRAWTIITSAFSHQMLAHFAFNMMSFHAFGTILGFVPGIGPLHVLSLCFGSAVMSSGAWLYQQQLRTPNQRQTILGGKITTATTRSALGASGMVMGAGAAAACLMPFAPIQVFLIPVSIPLWVATLAYVGADTYFLRSETSPIGHAAHLGGSIFGFAYYFAFLRGYGGVWHMLRRRVR